MVSYVSIALIMLLASISQSMYEDAYFIQEATLTVYRDGVVHVKIIASVNETEAFIIIPLLSSRISGLLIFDETGDLLNYDIEENNAVIYSLGATEVTLEYYVDDLTSKEAGLWTITLSAPFDLLIVLPENATIMYLSAVPSSISIEKDTIRLDLYPGDWEIIYELPTLPPSPPSPPPSQPPSAVEYSGYYYMLAAAIATICIVASTLLLIRRRSRIRNLRSEEIEVLRFLKDRGGRVLESELRERFPNIPRTSMWRLIRRLEKQGIVRVRKVGLQNLVEME
ncbi:hypothetical protein KEJ34_07800 [Candidatus Bathyarchaeota archaeon]|nr:hypothetical protein [Candidatus Bathyarchaeota archaeon]